MLRPASADTPGRGAGACHTGARSGERQEVAVRRAVLGAVAAVVAAAVGVLPVLRQDPLPVLRNDANWRTGSVLGRATLGARLIDPLAEDIWLADGTVPSAPSSGARPQVV